MCLESGFVVDDGSPITLVEDNASVHTSNEVLETRLSHILTRNQQSLSLAKQVLGITSLASAAGSIRYQRRKPASMSILIPSRMSRILQFP